MGEFYDLKLNKIVKKSVWSWDHYKYFILAVVFTGL